MAVCPLAWVPESCGAKPSADPHGMAMPERKKHLMCYDANTVESFVTASRVNYLTNTLSDYLKPHSDSEKSGPRAQ